MFGVDTEQLRFLGAVLALLAAAARAVPLVLRQVARREARVHHTRRLRVVHLARESQWGGHEWPAQWSDLAFRRRYWRKTRLHYASSVVVFALVLILFIWNVLIADTWQASLLFLFASAWAVEGVAVAAGTLYAIGRCPHAVWSPLRKEVSFVVAGTRADAFQYATAALAWLGARLVSCDEASGELQAKVGLWIPRYRTGQRLDVRISTDGCGTGRCRVTMSSDDVSPEVVGYVVSPHERNVSRFLRQWTFSPVTAQHGAVASRD